MIQYNVFGPTGSDLHAPEIMQSLWQAKENVIQNYNVLLIIKKT